MKAAATSRNEVIERCKEAEPDIRNCVSGGPHILAEATDVVRAA